MAFELTFLGTSTSVGVPVIGCDCPQCQSNDPKNNRTRSSIHIQSGDLSILVDTGPDLREQALRENLRKVDAVLYTHAHQDHIAGFDELRAFCWHRDTPLPIYTTASCLEALQRVYAWAFSPENTYKGYVCPEGNTIEAPFTLGDITITPLPVNHGSVECIGYRFDQADTALAYIPDVKTLKPHTRELLLGLDVLIVDALREAAHPTHMNVEEALELIADVQPKQAWLTHISHELDYRNLEAKLPPNILCAYDSLALTL